MNKKALIAMSGGVDSSVAAYLCEKQVYGANTGHLLHGGGEVHHHE